MVQTLSAGSIITRGHALIPVDDSSLQRDSLQTLYCLLH